MDSIENFTHSLNDFSSQCYSTNEYIYQLKSITKENEVKQYEIMDQVVSNGLSLIKNIRNNNTNDHPNEVIKSIISSLLKCSHYISEDSLKLIIQTAEKSLIQIESSSLYRAQESELEDHMTQYLTLNHFKLCCYVSKNKLTWINQSLTSTYENDDDNTKPLSHQINQNLVFYERLAYLLDPSRVHSFYNHLIQSGYLKDAIALYTHFKPLLVSHFHIQDIYNSLSIIPLKGLTSTDTTDSTTGSNNNRNMSTTNHASIEEFHEYLQVIIVPFLTHFCNNITADQSTLLTSSNNNDDDDDNDNNNNNRNDDANNNRSINSSNKNRQSSMLRQTMELVVNMADELSGLARRVEESERNPFHALLLADTTMTLLHTLVLGTHTTQQSQSHSVAGVVAGVNDSGSCWPQPDFSFIRSHRRMHQLFPTATSNNTTATAPTNNTTHYYDTVTKVFSLHFHLSLQKEVWLQWFDKARLDEVEELGLQGMTFSYLSTIQKYQYEETIQLHLLPFLMMFKVPLDVVINDWIRDALKTKVIVCDTDCYTTYATSNTATASGTGTGTNGDEEEEEDDVTPLSSKHAATIADADDSINSIHSDDTDIDIDNTATTMELSRAIRVLTLMRDPTLKAQVILLLLQLPAVNQRAVTQLASTHHRSGSDDTHHDFDTPPPPAAAVAAGEEEEGDASATSHPFTTNTPHHHNHNQQQQQQTAVSELCHLARVICQELHSSDLRDALIEALRLQRIRALIAAYNVDYIDSRNYRHIRSVAGLIAARVTSPTAIPDALELVQAWSAGGFDLAGLLSRAMVHRATYLLDTAADSHTDRAVATRTALLHHALKDIPSSRLKVTIEYTIDCLLHMMDETVTAVDITNMSTITATATATDSGTTITTTATAGAVVSEGDNTIKMAILCESAVCILAWYFDGSSHSHSLTATDTNTHHTATNNITTVIKDDIHSNVNIHTLLQLKRMKALYEEFGVCVSLSQLSQASVCRDIVSRVASRRVDEIVHMYYASYSADDSSSDGGADGGGSGIEHTHSEQRKDTTDTAVGFNTTSNTTATTAAAAPAMDGGEWLPVRYRRLCSSLGVSLIFLTHKILKLLFQRNEQLLAIQLAQSVGTVYGRLTTSTGTGSDSGSGTGAAQSSLIELAASEGDAALLIDMAVTLSTLAAKQTLQSTTTTTTGTTTSGRATMKESIHDKQQQERVIIHSFQQSKTILSSVCVSCASSQLSQTMDLLQGVLIVLEVFRRVDGEFALYSSTAAAASIANTRAGGSSNISSSNSSSGQNHTTQLKHQSQSQLKHQSQHTHAWRHDSCKIVANHFGKDGILMSAARVLAPLMRHCLSEIRRRYVLTQFNHYTSTAVVAAAAAGSNNNGGGSGNGSDPTEAVTAKQEDDPATDIIELVTVLQRSENHILSLRILLGSWHISATKAQFLRSSIISLCRKLLTYRDIDTNYSIASLAMLPFEMMVKELKSSVPSIQSDFSRLRIVASIGEELAQMWDQETLLIVFQSLQMNAKWWHILSSYGLKIDAKAFQNSDSIEREASIRAVVPLLLQHTGLNLEMARDYCQQFNLEPELAVLCYIELMLLQPPSLHALSDGDCDAATNSGGSSGGGASASGGGSSFDMINTTATGAGAVNTAAAARGVGRGRGRLHHNNNTLHTTATNTHWSRCIQQALIGVNENLIISLFQRVLPLIHSLDYEKIHFICTWLIEALREDSSGDSENDSESATYAYGDTDGSNGGGGDSNSNSSGGGGSKVSEIRNYMIYAEMVSFLNDLHLPEDKLQEVPAISHAYHSLLASMAPHSSSVTSVTAHTGMSDTSGNECNNTYTASGTGISGGSGTTSGSGMSGVTNMYRSRIPLWVLLDDPWSVLEPLLATDTQSVTKLSPLCAFLHIDKDEFLARAIMSAYSHAIDKYSSLPDSATLMPLPTNTTTSITSATTSYTTSSTAFSLNSTQVGDNYYNKAIHTLRHSIESIYSPLRRVEVWRWVYERELTQCPTIALVALNEAILILKQSIHHHYTITTATTSATAATTGASQRSEEQQYTRKQEYEEMTNILTELQMESIKINCQNELYKLCAVYHTGYTTSSAAGQTTSSGLLSPVLLVSLMSAQTAAHMVSKVYEEAIEACWFVYVDSYRGSGMSGGSGGAGASHTRAQSAADTGVGVLTIHDLLYQPLPPVILQLADALGVCIQSLCSHCDSLTGSSSSDSDHNSTTGSSVSDTNNENNSMNTTNTTTNSNTCNSTNTAAHKNNTTKNNADTHKQQPSAVALASEEVSSTVRMAIIMKLLSDVDPLVESSSSSSSNNSNNSNNNNSSSSSGHMKAAASGMGAGIVNQPTLSSFDATTAIKNRGHHHHSAAATGTSGGGGGIGPTGNMASAYSGLGAGMGGMWGHDDKSALTPSVSECRRAEDLYLAFSLAVIISSCQDLAQRFALIDLSKYKEGKFGMRWRTQTEVVSTKGQGICGSITCDNKDDLHSYEVPFKYNENDTMKYELVKVRLCVKCSKKLYKKKLKEMHNAIVVSATTSAISKHHNDDLNEGEDVQVIENPKKKLIRSDQILDLS